MSYQFEDDERMIYCRTCNTYDCEVRIHITYQTKRLVTDLCLNNSHHKSELTSMTEVLAAGEAQTVYCNRCSKHAIDYELHNEARVEAEAFHWLRRNALQFDYFDFDGYVNEDNADFTGAAEAFARQYDCYVNDDADIPECVFGAATRAFDYLANLENIIKESDDDDRS